MGREMTDRRRGRHGGPRKPAHVRRTPPPEDTGAETRFLHEVKSKRSPVVLELRDGARIEGVIEYFDREMIKITCDEGPNQLVRKHEIRTIHEAKATRIPSGSVRNTRT